MIRTENVKYGGWNNNVKLTNGKIELIVTQDIGPRIIRFGFTGQQNMFAEYKAQMGKSGESDWQIRGGHRLWLAPELKPMTYETDNKPIEIVRIKNGIKTIEPVGKHSGCQKKMTITMSEKNEVTIIYEVTNKSKKALTIAPWALTVCAPGGMEIIPLPEKISHTKALLPNQNWTIWAYTDFSDKRWMLGSRHIFLSQDKKKGPTKLGLALKEGWVGYALGKNLFVKKIEYKQGAEYPDGGCNFETFTNEDMLEVESLGPLVNLTPGKTIKHPEKWLLFDNVKYIKTESDANEACSRLLRRSSSGYEGRI